MKRNRILLLLLPLLVLASCGHDDEWDTGQTDADKAPAEIRFEMTHASATPETRVSTTGGVCTWTDGDKVGVYIVKGSGGLLASDNWVDNMEMTYNNGSWTHDPVYYPKDGDLLHFYAYYPYDGTPSFNPLSITFSAQTDQSSPENFSKSHLMFASTPSVIKSNDPVSLTFRQRMAMLKVKVIDGAGAHNIAPRPADKVTIIQRYSTTRQRLSDNAVMNFDPDPFPPRTDIKMYYNDVDECWYGLIAPVQSIQHTQTVLSLVWDGMTNLTHTHNGAQYSLMPGSLKPLEITINVTLDPEYEYEVGDVYPNKGFPMGVVFEISNGGKNGKIVSLDHIACTWGPEGTETGATNETDGRVNMATVKALDATFAAYPPFAWVHAKNPANTTYTTGAKGVWYLPVTSELMTLFGQLNTVNQTLGTGGWEQLRTNAGYWSSVELENDNAWIVTSRDAVTHIWQKHEYATVRAIMEF